MVKCIIRNFALPHDYYATVDPVFGKSHKIKTTGVKWIGRILTWQNSLETVTTKC